MPIDRVLQLLGALLAASLVRGLAVLAAAFAVTALAKRLSRESRHLVWFVALAVFLLIPLAWLALPPLPIDGGIPVPAASRYRFATAPVLSGSEYARLVDRSLEQAALARETPSVLQRGVHLALTAAWAVGALALVARLVCGWLRVRRLAAGAGGSRRLQSLADGISTSVRIHRRPRVLLAAGCRMPFTFGVLRPAIVLPLDARRWPVERAGSVLVHEVAHVARHDLLTQTIAYSACVLFWFVPAVWLAWAVMLREAEACCDQRVIDRGYHGSAYARDIVDLVRAAAGRILLPVHTAALVRKSMVRRRVETVLRLKPGGRRLGLRGTVGVLAVSLCCLLPLAVLSGSAETLRLPPDDPLFGTWVNAAYVLSEPPLPSRNVFSADNRRYGYHRLEDTEPYAEFINTFEGAWIDRAGNRWYKIRVITTVYPSGAGRKEGFSLARIDATGTVLEMTYAENGSPTTLEPVLSPRYTI
ncbi:MAG TPA: M56 family metallopeptidase, partial [Desulfobacterales bacterium]|nr:M56 family metallopeptidase [Desulfobacterales bacterium]